MSEMPDRVFLNERYASWDEKRQEHEDVEYVRAYLLTKLERERDGFKRDAQRAHEAIQLRDASIDILKSARKNLESERDAAGSAACYYAEENARLRSELEAYKETITQQWNHVDRLRSELEFLKKTIPQQWNDVDKLRADLKKAVKLLEEVNEIREWTDTSSGLKFYENVAAFLNSQKGKINE
jgi:chromosome segregation ATPase